MKSVRRVFFKIIFLLPFIISSVIFADPRECSASNAKFQKNYKTITHSLLPNNV